MQSGDRRVGNQHLCTANFRLSFVVCELFGADSAKSNPFLWLQLKAVGLYGEAVTFHSPGSRQRRAPWEIVAITSLRCRRYTDLAEAPSNRQTMCVGLTVLPL